MPGKKRKNKDPNLKEKATKSKSRDKSTSQVKETLSSQLRKQVGVVKTSTPGVGMFLHSRPTEKETCQKEYSPSKTPCKKTTKKNSNFVFLDEAREDNSAHIKSIHYSPPPPSLITPTSDHKEECEPNDRRDAGGCLFKHHRTILSTDVGSMSNPDQPCVTKTKLWDSVISSAWQAHDSLVTGMGSLLHQGRATSLDRKCATGSTSHDRDLSLDNSPSQVRRRNKQELASTCIDETASLSNEVSFLTAMRNHISPGTNGWPMPQKEMPSECADRESVDKGNSTDSPFKALSRGPSENDWKKSQEPSTCNPETDMVFTPSATTLLHKYDPFSSVAKTPETTEEWDGVEDYIPKRETASVDEHKSFSVQMQNKAVSPFAPTDAVESRLIGFKSLPTKEVKKKRRTNKSRSPRRSPRRRKTTNICASRSDDSIANAGKLTTRDMEQNKLLRLVLQQLNKQQAELKFHRKWMHNLSKERKGVVDKICNKLDKQVDLLQSEVWTKESQRQLYQKEHENVKAPFVEDNINNEKHVCKIDCGDSQVNDKMGVIFNRIQEALTKTTEIVMRAKESHSPKKSLIIGRETPFYDTLDTIVETDKECKTISENTKIAVIVPDKADITNELVTQSYRKPNLPPSKSPTNKRRSRMSSCDKSKRSRSAEQRKSYLAQKRLNPDTSTCNGAETSSIHTVVSLQRAHSELPFRNIHDLNTFKGDSQNSVTHLPFQDVKITKNMDENRENEQCVLPLEDVPFTSTNTNNAITSLEMSTIPYSKDLTLDCVPFQATENSKTTTVEESTVDKQIDVELSENVEMNKDRPLSLLDYEGVKQHVNGDTNTPLVCTDEGRSADATVESCTPLSTLAFTDVEQSDEVNFDAHTFCSELVSELADFEHRKRFEVNGGTPLSVLERLYTESDITDMNTTLPLQLHRHIVTPDIKCQKVHEQKPLSGLPPKKINNAQRAKSTLPFKEKKRMNAVITNDTRPKSAIPFNNINLKRFNSILVNTQKALSIMSLQDNDQANNEPNAASPGLPFENISQNKFIDKDQKSGIINVMEFNDSKEFSFVQKKSMFDANDSEASLLGLSSFKHSPDRLPFLVTTPTIASCSDSSMSLSDSYSFDTEGLTSMTQDSEDDSFREGFFFENMKSKSSSTIVSDDLERKKHLSLSDNQLVETPHELAVPLVTEKDVDLSAVKQKDSKSEISEKTDNAFRSWTSVTQSSMSEYSGRSKRLSRFSNKNMVQTTNPPSLKKFLNVLMVASMIVILLWIIVNNKDDVVRTLSYYYYYHAGVSSVYGKEDRSYEKTEN